MTIAKRLCVLGLFVGVLVGLGTFIGLGFGCGQDNMFASWLLIQAINICSLVVMLVGYNLKDEARSQKTCLAGLLLFAVAMSSAVWGFNYKTHGVWQPYAALTANNVTEVRLERDGQPLAAEDAERVLELMRQVKVQNPAMDGDWLTYPEAAMEGRRGYFVANLEDGHRSSLGLTEGYYFHGCCCFKAANPEVGTALQGLYAELAEKYAPAEAEAQVAAE